MSCFENAWLDAREPLDHAVRSGALAGRFAARLGERPCLLDLGSGTGSGIRYLAPRLRRAHEWIALDHDPALLGALRRAVPQDGTVQVSARLGDLNDLDLVPEFEACNAVTASALLDLAAAPWLDDLADRLAARPLPALFALSFDGRMTFTPERPEDTEIRARFVRHQRTDKGLGPALGPHAVTHLAAGMQARGLTVELAASDWRLGPACPELTLMFLDGLRRVLEETPGSGFPGWLSARVDDLEYKRLQIVIGHQDLLVL